MRCICGWGTKKPREGQRSFDHRCTYKAMGDRCEYPVGLFTEGSTSGWCIFHRQPGQPGSGAEIVRQSREIPYGDAVKKIMERNTRAQSVMEKAWDIALRHGNKPWQGDVAGFAQKVIDRAA
jgi:hypothetical protein